MQSNTLGELAKALTVFQAQVKAVTKDGKNPFFHSNYATLDNIIETVRAPLSNNGLSFTQFPTGENELLTILLHTSGEYIQSSMKMTPKDSSPQSLGSALTYARRYALSAVLGIATDEDDDGNAASELKSSKPAYAPKSAVKPVAPVAKENPLKREIKDLCDSLNPILKKGEYEKFVETETNLILVEQNYPQIIKKLKEKAEVAQEVRKTVESL